ncbi:prefoldin subunit 6-like [Octopus sinensis]|uniref:Prefoldin subunit 6-like n=1 Tax=Octopus sinensis TaxID=2607531 RepID=A0A7E6EI49_9MOLL|nr:prefoldin subunit 6-like [Octopus sinensis]
MTEQDLEKEVKLMKEMRNELAKVTTVRDKLSNQLNETNMVMSELKLLTHDSTVYKMVGPALIKQSTKDSQENVKRRGEYLTAEIERHEKIIKSHDEKLTNHTKKINELQAKLKS